MFDLFSDAAKVAQQMEIISSEYGFALWETLYSLVLEVLFAYVIGLPLGVLLDPGYVNQNDASIAAMTKGSYYLMLLGTVILAPVAEECVFRGLLFRNLWKVNMGAAYAVSMAAFSVIHIVNYVGVYSPLRLLLAFLQYLPAGLCLSWCYTKSGSIYGPIIMHSLINLYSLNLLR